MKKIIIVLSLLVIFLMGCEYFVLPSTEDTICEPPNQLIQDVNGNLVCVKVEEDAVNLEEKVDEIIETEVEKEEEKKEEPKVEVTEVTAAAVVETTVDQTPATVTELPRKVVTEGDFVSFPNLKAVDPDGDAIQYTYSAPLNEQGEWLTKVGDAAEYKVSIVASDGENDVSQDIILVVLPRNKAPTIKIEQSLTVKEGETVVLKPEISDPEGDRVEVVYEGWMTASEKKTNFADAGTHTVRITASDGVAKASKVVSVVVENVNRGPVIGVLGDITATAGDLVDLGLKVSDPDGDSLTVTYGDPIGNDGTWQTTDKDAAEYMVKVGVSDGTETVEKSVKIVVHPKNKAPVLSVADSVTVNEGELITLDATVTDPDGDDVIISYEGFMRSDTYQTDYNDAGSHSVTVTASDGINIVSKEVGIIINDVNRPPIFNPWV